MEDHDPARLATREEFKIGVQLVAEGRVDHTRPWPTLPSNFYLNIQPINKKHPIIYAQGAMVKKCKCFAMGKNQFGAVLNKSKLEINVDNLV
jgi:hypothetical protein